MSTRDYVAIAAQYEADVLAGTMPACRWVRLACERNRRDLQRQRSVAFPFLFDERAARDVCQAVELLPHTKGDLSRVVAYEADEQGLPTVPVWNTIHLEPWQVWVLTTALGWKRLSDRRRRFRTVLILVPRKNAKSTISAAFAIYMLTADGESGAECYSAATSRDQAKVVGDILWVMVSRSTALREHFGVRLGSRTSMTVEVPQTNSKFLPLSADAHSLDGLNVHLAVIDELHAHKTRQVWDVLETATGARSQPMIWAISTAGSDTGGICYEQVEYLHRVLEGKVEDETYFGVNYTIDQGDDWRIEETWRKANPNFGVSVKPDDLARLANKAQHSNAAINNFLTKRLNVWVRGDATWMPMAEWLACGDAALRIADCRDWPCWIGVDLAETRDIAAVVVLFKKPDQTFVVFGRYYLPQDAIERSPVAQYSGWVREGWLTATEGNVADYQRIQSDIVELCRTYRVQEIDFDRALARQMQQQLEALLGGTPPVVEVPQNLPTMNSAMQTLEGLVLSGKIRHPADPVLTWMASNVVTFRNDKDEVYPRKAGGKDSHHKIDGIVALLTALSRVSIQAEPEPQYQMLVMGGK